MVFHFLLEILNVLRSFLKFLEVFGPIRTHSDPFGPIWMHSDALGCVRKQVVGFGKVGTFEIFCDFFGCCRMALRVLWSVLNITLSFQTFSDVLDNFSYLLSLVIYREPPLLLFHPTLLWDKWRLKIR